MDEVTQPPPSNSRAMLWAILLVLVACSLFLLLLMTGQDVALESRSTEESVAIGRKLAGVDLEPLLGNPPRLKASNLNGKVVLLNFWGPWCTYCRMEMPSLVRINDRLVERPDFLFVSVSCSGSMETENLDELREQSADYLKTREYSFPVHCDPGGETRQSIVDLANLKGEGFSYPMTLVLDQQGTIRAVFPGYRPDIEKELDRVVMELLEGGS